LSDHQVRLSESVYAQLSVEADISDLQLSARAYQRGHRKVGLCSGRPSGFMQFAAFDQDAIDNEGFVARGKLDIPYGGGKSFGRTIAEIMRFAAKNVHEGVLPHWIMEENPTATISMLRAFLDTEISVSLQSAVQRFSLAPGSGGKSQSQ
jgi:hypothetical protein